MAPFGDFDKMRGGGGGEGGFAHRRFAPNIKSINSTREYLIT